MTQAFICDAIRTPFGRYGGALSSVRTDDLGAIPIKALMSRNPKVDWQALTEEGFKEVFRHSPLRRTKFNGIQRNLKFLEL